MSSLDKPKRRNVNAPFKSPLRLSASANTDNETKRTSKENDNYDKRHRSPIKFDKPSITRQSVDYDSEIKKYIAELMENRSDPIDIEEELNLWRSRMHAYNEAKDSCLVLFGQLAHLKGCLVKELYAQHGLELDD